MSHFICPVCGEPLFIDGKQQICKNHHTYDIAKAGYINLLQSQKSAQKRHGDDKLMVRCRKEFLDKGYYACLLDELVKQCLAVPKESLSVLDVGCGEGWYSDRIFTALQSAKSVTMSGVDISKDALIYAAKRNRDIAWAVASVSKLPVADQSVDILINLFAPFDESEFHRVLRPGGIFIRAIALEKHLWGLKEKIYDHPYENQPQFPILRGFEGPQRKDICQTISLTDPEDIDHLFKMTPYYYKTSPADQAKLAELKTLTTAVEFSVLTYQKSPLR